MKIKGVILILAFGSGLSAVAQGVLLRPGDTLSLEFNGVGGCQFTEATTRGGAVNVFLGNDSLESGESLRLEMFENNLSEPAVATQTYTPTSPATYVNLRNGDSWLDYQGMIRISMLSGSVNVDYAEFFVKPDIFTICSTTVVVPEPRASLLALLATIIAVVVWFCRRTCRQIA